MPQCDQIELQAELYNEYAAEDKLLNFQEFSELYKVESGKASIINIFF